MCAVAGVVVKGQRVRNSMSSAIRICAGEECDVRRLG